VGRRAPPPGEEKNAASAAGGERRAPSCIWPEVRREATEES
jgi:hypothetical protein